jgi:hypothetical protein
MAKEKQTVHDWSSGSLEVYEIEVEETVQAEPSGDEQDASTPDTPSDPA